MASGGGREDGKRRSAGWLEAAFVLALLAVSLAVRLWAAGTRLRAAGVELFVPYWADSAFRGPLPSMDFYQSSASLFLQAISRDFLAGSGAGVLTAGRYVTAFCSALSCVFFYLWLRRAGIPAVGGGAGAARKALAVLFALLPVNALYGGAWGWMPEVILVLPMTAFLFLWETKGGRAAAWILAGFGVAIKLLFLYFLAPFLLLRFLSKPPSLPLRRNPGWRAVVSGAAFFLLGGGILALNSFASVAWRPVSLDPAYPVTNARSIFSMGLVEYAEGDFLGTGYAGRLEFLDEVFDLPHLVLSWHRWRSFPSLGPVLGAASIAASLLLLSAGLLAPRGRFLAGLIVMGTLLLFVPVSIPMGEHSMFLVPLLVALLGVSLAVVLRGRQALFLLIVCVACAAAGATVIRFSVSERPAGQEAWVSMGSEISGYLEENGAFSGGIGPALVGRVFPWVSGIGYGKAMLLQRIDRGLRQGVGDERLFFGRDGGEPAGTRLLVFGRGPWNFNLNDPQFYDALYGKTDSSPGWEKAIEIMGFEDGGGQAYTVFWWDAVEGTAPVWPSE